MRTMEIKINRPITPKVIVVVSMLFSPFFFSLRITAFKFEEKKKNVLKTFFSGIFDWRNYAVIRIDKVQRHGGFIKFNLIVPCE